MISVEPNTTSGIEISRPNTTSDRVAVCGGGDRQHVVEAHDDVGDRDDAHGLPQCRAAGDVLLVGLAQSAAA